MPADGILKIVIPIKHPIPRAMHDRILVSRNLAKES